MIRNERGLQAALEWIEYWKSTRTVGQSWIGNEQAAQKIIELRKQIDAYRQRSDARSGTAPLPPADSSPEADQSASSSV
jgi:hypothetical protein